MDFDRSWASLVATSTARSNPKTLGNVLLFSDRLMCEQIDAVALSMQGVLLDRTFVPQSHAEAALNEDGYAADYLRGSTVMVKNEKDGIRIVPARISSHGNNCLCGAVSYLLFGTEIMSALLRSLVVADLKHRDAFYRERFGADEYDEMLVEAVGESSLGFAHAEVLASVIRRVIVVIASDADVRKFGNARNGVAYVAKPLYRTAVAGPIAIAWQSSARNHFCALTWVESDGRLPVWIIGDEVERVRGLSYNLPPSPTALVNTLLMKMKKIANEKAKDSNSCSGE